MPTSQSLSERLFLSYNVLVVVVVIWSFESDVVDIQICILTWRNFYPYWQTLLLLLWLLFSKTSETKSVKYFERPIRSSTGNYLYLVISLLLNIFIPPTKCDPFPCDLAVWNYLKRIRNENYSIKHQTKVSVLQFFAHSSLIVPSWYIHESEVHILSEQRNIYQAFSNNFVSSSKKFKKHPQTTEIELSL